MKLRSAQTTEGRLMTGARSLWRANGMSEEQIGKPVIAIANSFTQFVPGHVHLHDIGQKVKGWIEEQGCFAAEFNTIAIDDGIAMGHDGMLYSLPSREVIADSVEYMCNAHKADALICISNCDKITPGMMIAAMRLNIPTIFVTGGPMEAGVMPGGNRLDLVDAMVKGGESEPTDAELLSIERAACPTCGSCSGMFTANSMNCLAEALGMALPGNGTLLATHARRELLFKTAARRIVEMTDEYYGKDNDAVLPRSIATRAAFSNAMALDIAMGGSTNTVLHLLAIARAAEVDFTMKDIDALSRKIPNICKVAPSSSYHIEDVNRAGGILSILGELERGGVIDTTVVRADGLNLLEAIETCDITRSTVSAEALENAHAAPGGVRSIKMGSQNKRYEDLDTDRSTGCIRNLDYPYNKEGGLAVLFGNIAERGCIVKTAGVDESIYVFEGPARVYESQEDACKGILDGEVVSGEVVIIRYEGPKGGPGMQEMLYPTSYLKSRKLGKECALITDGRFSGGTSGLSIGHASPEAAAGGAIALIRTGDPIKIDIPGRTIDVLLDNAQLDARRKEEEARGEKAYTPVTRNRVVSQALQLYSMHASSADEGAARKL